MQKMKKTIVIAEDFENTRWVIEFSLKKLDAEILKAENGEIALRYFDGRNIDLLISDLNMPVLNGIDLVKQVKQLDEYRHLPVIMLTTEVNPEKKKAAEEAKISFWVQKPFKQEQFQKIIEKLLK